VNAQNLRNDDNRRMTRWESEDVLERRPQRREHHPGMMRQRKAMVEPPVGPIKRWMDQGYCLRRGTQNVSTAMRWSMLTYHIKRGRNILGVKTMIEALA
jgi:hypothetical protein